jgi:oligosaccharide repeat unit polymerase
MLAAAILMLSLTLFMLAMSPLGRVSPSALLAGGWSIVYLLQWIFASDMYSSWLGTGTVFTISLSFALGELIGTGGMHSSGTVLSRNDTMRLETENCVNARRLRRLIVAVSVLGAVSMLAYAQAMGIFSARSIEDLILIPGAARVAMFTGDLSLPMYSKVGVLFAYPGVILALGYFYYYRWRWWLILPMINVLLFGAIQAGRAGTMIILLQALITVYLKNSVLLRRTFFRIFLTIALPVMLMSVIFIGGQFLREGFHAQTSDDVMRVIDSLRGYLFGGVSAYSYWTDHVYNWGKPTLGKYSFSSLFSAVGIAEQEPGVYNSYVPIAPNGDTTNLYTAYRSFIDDFSIYGACFFYLLSGVFTAVIMRQFVRGKHAWIFVLIPVLSWLAFSPNFSMTYFNSFLLSCILPYLLMKRHSGIEHAAN